MKSQFTHRAITGILAGLAITASSPGQTIGIRVDGNVHLDVDTIPNEQFWVTESPDLLNWTNHTFVDHSSNIDCGLPSGRRFYKLDPLYGPISWTPLPNMPVARDQFTGGVIDGKIYIFGGNGDPDGRNLSRLDIYNLETGQWTRGANYTLGIEELSGAVVGGKLYVWARQPSRTLCYEPETNSWAELAIRPSGAGSGTVVAWGLQILAVGDLGFGIRKNVIEAYDTVANKWRFVTDLPYNSEQFGVGIYKDVLYLIGGYDHDTGLFLNRICRFDLKLEAWLPEIHGTLPHPIFVPYSSACPVVNGKIIMAGGLAFERGGWSGAGDQDLILSNLVTAYDTQQNTFSHNGTLPLGVWQNLCLRGEERLYILGGTTGPFGADTRTATILSGTFGD